MNKPIDFLRNWGIILVCSITAVLILFLAERAHAEVCIQIDDEIVSCPGKPLIILL
jgi:hypothetical protein